MAMSEQDLPKLPAMLEELALRYGVDPGDWFALALALAFKHEPNFKLKIKKKSGRRMKWHEFRLLKLWWDVEELRRKNKSLSVSAACVTLAREDHWKGLSLKGSTLRTKYEKTAKSSWLVSEIRKLPPRKQRELLNSLDKKLW